MSKTATDAEVAAVCFSAWRYDSPQPGVYDWTTPSGTRFRVIRDRRHGPMPIITIINHPPDDPPEP